MLKPDKVVSNDQKWERHNLASKNAPSIKHSVCSDHTFPSHNSKVATFIEDCSHLLWNNLPSKNSHGQQNSHGTGDPQASLAIIAASTPLMKIDANCMALQTSQNQVGSATSNSLIRVVLMNT